MSDDAALIARLMPEDYKARSERALLFVVAAWDTNCPQHIPRKVNIADVTAMLSARDERIAVLEAQLVQARMPPTSTAYPTHGDNA